MGIVIMGCWWQQWGRTDWMGGEKFGLIVTLSFVFLSCFLLLMSWWQLGKKNGNNIFHLLKTFLNFFCSWYIASSISQPFIKPRLALLTVLCVVFVYRHWEEGDIHCFCRVNYLQRCEKNKESIERSWD